MLHSEAKVLNVTKLKTILLLEGFKMERIVDSKKMAYHSAQGAKNISQNALSHGLTSKQGIIMPCLKRCIYKDACLVYSQLYSSDEEKFDGQQCAIELAYLIVLKNKFNSEQFKDTDKTLVKEYISLRILQDRSLRGLSIFPDLFDGEGLKFYTYFIRYQKKAQKVINKMMCTREQ
jgi:hypothetical protein